MKYSDAGVDVAKADEAMSAIKSLVKSTYTKNVMGEFGSFGGLFSLPTGYKEPVLVASVDGVGTKLAIAIETGSFSTVGEDIVNHCVDDILVQGATPLFFLDYYATGVLEQHMLVGVLEGLSKACRENGCALLGGETAEMPGFYKKGDFDLAGTIVGIAEKDHLITGTDIKAGDVILGLASSGLHTNGYSLARKVLQEKAGYKFTDIPDGFTTTLGKVLSAPHKSYLHSLKGLIPAKTIKGLVHITGGGFQGNIPRVLPVGVGVEINIGSWLPPAIYGLIQSKGEVELEEMYRTLNMGMGMLVFCAPENQAAITAHLEAQGEKPIVVGKCVSAQDEDHKVILKK